MRHAVTGSNPHELAAVGLLIRMQSPDKHGMFRISNCSFSNNASTNNIAKCNDRERTLCADQSSGLGGGLAVLVKGSSGNTIELVDGTTFVDNAACFGGGAYISIHGQSSNQNPNVLTISDATFDSNSACTLGGGLYVDDGSDRGSDTPLQISIVRTVFTRTKQPMQLDLVIGVQENCPSLPHILLCSVSATLLQTSQKIPAERLDCTGGKWNVMVIINRLLCKWKTVW